MKIELYNDNFQNYKRYNIPRANLVLTDIPYNVGANAYTSVPHVDEVGVINVQGVNYQQFKIV